MTQAARKQAAAKVSQELEDEGILQKNQRFCAVHVACPTTHKIHPDRQAMFLRESTCSTWSRQRVLAPQPHNPPSPPTKGKHMPRTGANSVPLGVQAGPSLHNSHVSVCGTPSAPAPQPNPNRKAGRSTQRSRLHRNRSRSSASRPRRKRDIDVEYIQQYSRVRRRRDGDRYIDEKQRLNGHYGCQVFHDRYDGGC